ncbi:MAG: D-alanyl-D-alanine carboxypeptidase [Lactobacillales bacterium]|jgi:D-alanyl-D-alanine carboxypeptidase (penicillin-binding protein 5/6)|nr:D-alanyl-D-alanine carboxypeptidase [Lactobacillales bacterium]
MKKRMLLYSGLIFALVFVLMGFRALESKSGVAKLDGRACILQERSTGEILYKKNATKKFPVASLTKLLTAYTVLQEIKEGRIGWNDTLSLSEYGRTMTADVNLSNVPMEVGEEYTVRDLLNGLFVASGNNCAITLAEGISGSEQAFLEKMELQLQNLEIKNYVLVNCSGLDNSSIPEIYRKGKRDQMNLFSAKDILLIASHLITEFPEVLDITQQTSTLFGTQEIYTYNKMLPSLEYGYEGVDGLKTGTTESAGACLVVTCVQEGRRMLSVVLGAKEDENRYEDTKKLLDFGFSEESRT